MESSLLIFTDLDGTLLDHHTYSFAGAADTLQRLHHLSIPLVLTSSKTRMELLGLQKQLGLSEAFISENGGGIFIPQDHALHDPDFFEEMDGCRGVVFGRPYDYIRQIFARFREPYKLKGFGDMSVEEIMDLTDLNREDAELAVQRDFSEPFLFLEQPRPRELQKDLAGFGLTLTRGGRFYHLMGEGQDKGRAVTEAKRLFAAVSQKKMTTVGLGDAPNDFTMLKAVDIPVLIPRPDGSFEHMELAGLRKAPFPGSRGWGVIVAEILDELAKQP